VAADRSAPVQIFGYRDSRPTQRAVRFFRDRRIEVAFVDLSQRPIARGELQRFYQKFGAHLLDVASRPFRDAGLGYIRMDESEIFERLLVNPRLILVPLVRRGNGLAVGLDEPSWKQIAGDQ
jgi:arsenate reductase